MKHYAVVKTFLGERRNALDMAGCEIRSQLDDDIAAALEWQRWKDSLCTGCGQPRDESFSPTGPDYRARSRRCRCCEALDVEAKEWSESSSSTSGVYLSVDRDQGGER